MKHLFYTLVLLLAVSFGLSACKEKAYSPLLRMADSLANVLPDSAISLLAGMKEEMDGASEATQMYYRLLCIKANDKAYILHTSDSLILPVLRYYIEKDDRRHLPEAYYYAGRVYRDLEDAPQALEYFEKAMETLPKETDVLLKSKIYSQVGTLYLYQGLYNEALEVFKKKLACNVGMKDSVSMVYTLRDIGDAFRRMNENDSCLHYFQSAYDIGMKLQRRDFTSMIQSQIASLYTRLGRYEEANVALQDALENKERPNKSGIYTIAGTLYYARGNIDSAAYYFKALLDVGTIYSKETAHRSLAEIALSRGNSSLAAQHIRAYLQCNDSIRKITYTENAQRMHSLYNYRLREKENNRLKAENRKKDDYLWYGLIGFLGLSSLFMAYYQYSRRKQLQMKQQLQKIERIKEENYRKSQAYIDGNNLRIRKLEGELMKVHSTNEMLCQEIEKQKELIRQDNRRAEIEQDRSYLQKRRLAQSDICTRLNGRLRDSRGRIFITAEEWQSLRLALKNVYPDFFDKLDGLYSFSELQQQVCILIKFGFSPSEIAKLMERPKETITSIRRRLYSKVFQKEGKPEDWDIFVLSL